MINLDKPGRPVQQLSRRHAPKGARALKWLAGLALVLSLMVGGRPGQAQESPITATVNSNSASTDQLVVLLVTVVDDSPQQPRPILPALDGLAVVDLDIATNVRLVNNRIQTEVIYTYRLQPRKTGRLTIPPITVKIDDQVYEAAPIELTVSQGAAPVPSPGNAASPDKIDPPAALKDQDFFVEAVVEPATPYVGQQIIYTFRFYQAIQLHRQPQFEMPIFSGFDTIGLPVREYNLDVEDRTYLISEVRTALFPKSSGSFLLGAAQLVFPGTFFEEPVELYTEPILVEVKPLPANAPPGFNGAVGQYEVESWLSPQVAIINQPARLHVAVSGVGNIHALPEPNWPPLNGWRVYDSLSSLTTEMQEGMMTGTRVFERLIVSNRVGKMTLPPTKLVYFDPIAARYRTIETKALPVQVMAVPTPAPGTATAIALSASATATPVAQAQQRPTQPQLSNSDELNRDLFGLRNELGITLPLSLALLWALCGAVPVAAVVGAGGVWLWQRRQTERKEEKEAMAAEATPAPEPEIHPALVEARRQHRDNYKLVSTALEHYLSQKLHTPVSGLTQTELAKRLKEAGVTPGLTERVIACLADSEMGRYGLGADDEGLSLLSRAEALLRELDEALGKAI